jgi:hypothetical protein
MIFVCFEAEWKGPQNTKLKEIAEGDQNWADLRYSLEKGFKIFEIGGKTQKMKLVARIVNNFEEEVPVKSFPIIDEDEMVFEGSVVVLSRVPNNKRHHVPIKKQPNFEQWIKSRNMLTKRKKIKLIDFEFEYKK